VSKDYRHYKKVLKQSVNWVNADRKKMPMELLMRVTPNYILPCPKAHFGLQGLHDPKALCPITVMLSDGIKVHQAFCTWCDYASKSTQTVTSHMLGRHYHTLFMCEKCKLSLNSDFTNLVDHFRKCEGTSQHISCENKPILPG
jgi:hypothetical protein